MQALGDSRWSDPGAAVVLHILLASLNVHLVGSESCQGAPVNGIVLRASLRKRAIVLSRASRRCDLIGRLAGGILVGRRLGGMMGWSIPQRVRLRRKSKVSSDTAQAVAVRADRIVHREEQGSEVKTASCWTWPEGVQRAERGPRRTGEVNNR